MVGRKRGQRADVAGRDNVVVQIVGDGNVVVAGHAHLTLTRYVARRRDIRTDAERLAAYSRSIPLIGREVLVAEQWAWLDGDAAISVRVLIGGAGRGKTRLALELCEQAVECGWDAGFATDREMTRFTAQQNLSAWGWRRPTLVVIDYASQRTDELRAWLAELSNHDALAGGDAWKDRPLRVILLDREAPTQGGWWDRAFGEGGGEATAIRRLLDPERPGEVPSLAGPAFRRAVLDETLKALGSTHRAPPGDATFDRKLADLAWGGEPLFLMMAALAAATVGLDHVLALSRTDLARELAKRETDRIHGVAADRDVNPALLSHMAAFVTLCQGLTRAEAREAAKEEALALDRTNGCDPPDVVDALAIALGADEATLRPIVPDILGEAVVLRALEGSPSDGVPGTVARAARRFPVRVCASVVRTVQDYAPHGVTEPLDWIDRLIATAQGDARRMFELVDSLPEQTLVLRERAASLTADAAALLRGMHGTAAAGNVRGLLATTLNSLAVRLGDMGRREEALAAAEEAVGIYRELAAARPNSFRPGLAMSLNNLGNFLGNLGRRDDALAATGEAVGVYRELAGARPDDFFPALAMSLNNLGSHLGDLGRREEALVAAEEAARIYRELAAARPDAFLPTLATSLNNLGVRFGDLGRRQEALAAAEEAARIRRELAAAHPDAFLPALATSLTNLGNRFSDLGRREEALEATEEAAKIHGELAAARPDAFLPDLATSLSNLGNRLSDLGRREDALAVSEKAASIRRELAAACPDAFLPALATSLNNLGVRFSDVGRWEEALAAAREAVSIHRELAVARPDAFLLDRAMSLNNLGGLLGDLGRRGETLVVLEEAVLTLLPRFERVPAAFSASMGKMALNWFRIARELNREPDAVLLSRVVAVFEKLQSGGES